MRTVRALAVLLFAMPCFAATYYVSPTGDDAARGTSLRLAWKSIAHVNAVHFAAGDKVLFEGGNSFSGKLVVASGVTYGSFGSGAATLSGGDDGAIVAKNVAGFRITNLTLVGTSLDHGVLNASGIVITNDGSKLHGVTIDHVDISGFSLAGILMQSGGRFSGYDNVSIRSSSIHDNGYVGIALSGEEVATFSGVDIAHVEVRNINGYRNSYGQLVEGSGTGIDVSGALSITITDNAVHDNGAMSSGPAGISVLNATDVTIAHNEVWNVHTLSSFGGEAIRLDRAESVLVEGNYTHTNDGSSLRLIANGATVRFDISDDDGRRNRAPALSISGSGVDVIRNTIALRHASEMGAATALFIDASDALVANNLSATSAGVKVMEVPSSSSPRFIANDYFAAGGPALFDWHEMTYSGFDAWNATQPASPSTGFSADPRFIADTGTTMYPRPTTDLGAFQFTTTSPLYDSGADLEMLNVNTGQHDFAGHGVHDSFAQDIGAFELPFNTARPSIEAIADQTVALNESAVVDVFAHDADGSDAITLSLVNAPSFVQLANVSNARARIVIQPTFKPAPFVVTVRASVPGDFAEQSFRVTVTGETGSKTRAVRH